MHAYFTLFLLLFSTTTFTQVANNTPLVLKVSPLSLFDPTAPGLQAGLEFGFAKKWSLQAEYVLNSSTLPFIAWDYKNQAVVKKYRLGVRRYYKSKPGLMRFYAGEFFHIAQVYEKNNSLYTDGVNWYQYDKGDIDRRTNGWSIRWGTLYDLTKSRKWTFEWSVGVGNRVVNVAHTNLINPQVTNRPFREFQIVITDDLDAQRSIMHLNAGISIGYVLNKIRR